MSTQQNHDLVFADHNDEPYTCCFCGHRVHMGRTMVVHHLDHDRANNAPGNLAAAHTTCHVSHHMLAWYEHST